MLIVTTENIHNRHETGWSGGIRVRMIVVNVTTDYHAAEENECSHTDWIWSHALMLSADVWLDNSYKPPALSGYIWSDYFINRL